MNPKTTPDPKLIKEAELTKCLVCDLDPICFEWTDFHGQAVCFQCGQPYQLIHYENKERVRRPAKFNGKDVELQRRFWAETKIKLPKCIFNFNEDIDVQTEETLTRMNEWYENNAPGGAP